jgi:hypothetical protein
LLAHGEADQSEAGVGAMRRTRGEAMDYVPLAVWRESERALLRAPRAGGSVIRG